MGRWDDRAIERWGDWLICLLLFSLLFGSLNGARAAETEWAQAMGPRIWNFPWDHGAHPEYRTEWWYFTGNLMDDAGSRYGYQLTFFR